MSLKAASWTLLIAMALGAILLFNYWAPYQFLSLLAYSGIVLALCGLANLLLPFRFLGVRKRAVGAFILAGGVVLTLVGLRLPDPTIHIAQHRSRLDDILPEYQGSERHSVRIHARPEQVMQGVRQSTMGDLRSLDTLLRVRAAVLRIPFQSTRELRDKRMIDSFLASGYLFDESEHEIVIFTVGNVRAIPRPEVHTLQEFADYREPGAVKTAFDFRAEEAGEGWSTLTTETRVVGLDDISSGPGTRYWRLILPGSGLLRRQWLEGIKKRTESMPNPPTEIPVSVK